MCTYARTVFECRHQAWGRRLKLCAAGEDHRTGDAGSDCALRKPHGLHSRRVPRQCDKCSELDRKRSLLRAKLDECREMFRRQYPDYWPGDDDDAAARAAGAGPGTDDDNDDDGDDGDGDGDGGWVTGEAWTAGGYGGLGCRVGAVCHRRHAGPPGIRGDGVGAGLRGTAK